MINLIFIFLFVLVTVTLFYHIQIGFSFIVAMIMAIPPNVRLNLTFVDIQFHNALLLVLLFAFIFNYFRNKIHQPPFIRLIVIPFLSVSILLAIIVLFAPTLDLMFHYKVLYFVIYNYFIPCIIAFYIFNNSKDINRFFLIVLVTTLIISLYGIYCYLTLTNPYIAYLIFLYPGMDALSFMDETRGGLNGRIQGTLLHPLIWGGLCLLVYFFLYNNIKNVFFRIFVVSLLFLNIVFSGSRSALISFFIGIIYLFALSKLKIKLKYTLYIAGVAILLTIAIYQIPVLKRYSALFESVVFFWDDDGALAADFGGSTFIMRINQIEGTFEMIKESLLTGLGQGYTNYYQEEYGVHPVLFGFESIFFLALINSGILGLVVWLYLFYVLYRNSTIIQKRFKNSDSQPFLMLKAFVLIYLIFIILTGFQNVLTLFLIFYIIMFKQLYLVK